MILISFICVIPAFAKDVKMKATDSLGIDPNIMFLFEGPSLDEQNTRFRVVLYWEKDMWFL